MEFAVYNGIMKRLDLAGKTFHNLTAVSIGGVDKKGHILWTCRCTCGVEKLIPTGHLTRRVNPVKSCGCLRHRKGYKNPCWNGFGDISGDWWTSHVLRSANSYRPKKVTISIKQAWTLLCAQNFKCALSGIPIEIRDGTASLDRIDSAKDYEMQNVQWVHKHVNIMKNKFEQGTFVNLCKLIATHSKQI